MPDEMHNPYENIDFTLIVDRDATELEYRQGVGPMPMRKVYPYVGIPAPQLQVWSTIEIKDTKEKLDTFDYMKKFMTQKINMYSGSVVPIEILKPGNYYLVMHKTPLNCLKCGIVQIIKIIFEPEIEYNDVAIYGFINNLVSDYLLGHGGDK